MRLQIDAVRQLLKYSLREPANQRFVVVSESCIPLYPAWLLYAQLLTEKKSRINACTNPQNPQDEQLRMVSRWVACTTDRPLNIAMMAEEALVIWRSSAGACLWSCCLQPQITANGRADKQRSPLPVASLHQCWGDMLRCAAQQLLLLEYPACCCRIAHETRIDTSNLQSLA